MKNIFDYTEIKGMKLKNRLFRFAICATKLPPTSVFSGLEGENERGKTVHIDSFVNRWIKENEADRKRGELFIKK